jgi:hypothetical protein
VENFALTFNDSDMFDLSEQGWWLRTMPINQQVTFKKLYVTTGKNEQLFQW